MTVLAPSPDQLSFSDIISQQNRLECPSFKPSQKSVKAVWDLLKTGRWYTKPEIHYHTGVTEHAVSARLSDLKRLGFPSEKRKADNGLYRYRLLLPSA